MNDFLNDENALSHYGVGHEDGGHSGRYPWGSGEQEFKTAKSFYDRVNIFKKRDILKLRLLKCLNLILLMN